MAAVSTCVRVARSLRLCGLTQPRISISSCFPKPHLQYRRDASSDLCRQFSTLSLTPPPSRTPATPTNSSLLRHKTSLSPRLNGCCMFPLVPVRTVVKHSKMGKMKTVKAVAKRFRRTGSGKLKFWPPGNVHNLMSKSHDRKCRIRKPRYASKSQAKTLNKMLIGRYS